MIRVCLRPGQMSPGWVYGSCCSFRICSNYVKHLVRAGGTQCWRNYSANSWRKKKRKTFFPNFFLTKKTLVRFLSKNDRSSLTSCDIIKPEGKYLADVSPSDSSLRRALLSDKNTLNSFSSVSDLVSSFGSQPSSQTEKGSSWTKTRLLHPHDFINVLNNK
jgi:hypothetical protein